MQIEAFRRQLADNFKLRYGHSDLSDCSVDHAEASVRTKSTLFVGLEIVESIDVAFIVGMDRLAIDEIN